MLGGGCGVQASAADTSLALAWRSVVIRWRPGTHTPASHQHLHTTLRTHRIQVTRLVIAQPAVTVVTAMTAPAGAGQARQGEPGVRRGAKSFLIRSYLAPGYICPLHCNGRQPWHRLTRPPPRWNCLHSRSVDIWFHPAVSRRKLIHPTCWVLIETLALAAPLPAAQTACVWPQCYLQSVLSKQPSVLGSSLLNNGAFIRVNMPEFLSACVNNGDWT